MKQSVPWLAYFLAIVNATIIGLSFMFTRIAVMRCPPLDTLAFRFLVGGSVFLIYVAAARIPLRRPDGTWIRLLPIMLFYPLGFFTFQAFGLRRIPSAEAGILSASAPVLTAILAALFIREKTNGKQFVSIGVSVLGVVYIAWMQGGRVDSAHTTGMILILLSCLCSAGYTICNRVLVRSFHAAEITSALMLSGAVLFSGAAVAKHASHGTLTTMFEPLRDAPFVLAILYLGIFASLMTTILASLILKRIGSSQLVIFFNLATVVSIVAGYLFLGEEIHDYHILGTAMIIAGVVGTNYFAKT